MSSVDTRPVLPFQAAEDLYSVACDITEKLVNGSQLSHKECERYRLLVLAYHLSEHGLPEWVDDVDIDETDDYGELSWLSQIENWPSADQ